MVPLQSFTSLAARCLVAAHQFSSPNPTCPSVHPSARLTEGSTTLALLAAHQPTHSHGFHSTPPLPVSYFALLTPQPSVLSTCPVSACPDQARALICPLSHPLPVCAIIDQWPHHTHPPDCF